MKKFSKVKVSAVLGLCAGVLWVSSAAAQLPAETSLDKCQKTAAKEGAKFAKLRMSAVAKCLKKASGEVIKKNAADASAAAKACVNQFRKLVDTRATPKDLETKLRAKIKAACDPAEAATTHTTDDITGKGTPSVSEPIDTMVNDTYCSHFGGDGSIDSYTEWEDCIVAAHKCEADQGIAVQYPRAPEWLDEIDTGMGSLSAPAGDPSKIADAQAGLAEVNTNIDTDGDDVPDISCGPPPTAVCSSACCYLEDILPPGPGTGETACVEYTGTGAQVGAFLATCGPGGVPGPYSLPGGFWRATGIPGPCGLSPNTLVACVPAVNLVIAPKDSSCP